MFLSWLINELVAGLLNVFTYLDDIIAMSKTKEQHAQLLGKLFDCFKIHGLVVNETKCVFCVSTFNVLRHTVSEDDIASKRGKGIDNYKVSVIISNKKQRKFLEMYQYFANL